MENIGQLVDAVKSNPEMAKVTFSANSQWKGGTKCEVTIAQLHAGGENIARPDRSFKLLIDEPSQLGGTDEAPNPVEYLAAGLCGCLTAGIATNAAMFGTELDTIEVSVEADFDLHGVLGLDKNAPNGAVELRYTVKMHGPGDHDKMIKSKETIDRKSPIRNTLSLPLMVATDIQVGDSIA
jgi:uncharacterized OsmC-like protein